MKRATALTGIVIALLVSAAPAAQAAGGSDGCFASNLTFLGFSC